MEAEFGILRPRPRAEEGGAELRQDRDAATQQRLLRCKEGAESQGMQAPLEAEKGKEAESPLQPPEKEPTLPTLDCNPARLTLDFGPPEP